MRKVIMGNHSLSYGAMLSRAQVIAAYPITPQTQVVELISECVLMGPLMPSSLKLNLNTQPWLPV